MTRMLSRSLSILCLALWLPLPVRTVAAAPATSYFAALVSALDAIAADTALPARQQKAATKALARIAKPSSALATDLRTAAAVTRRLAKAFADDFSGGTGLAALAADLVAALQGDVSTMVGAIDATVAGLAAGACKDKSTRQSDKLAAALATATSVGDPAKRALALVKTLVLAARTQKAAGKCTGGGGGGGDTCTGANTLVISDEGTPWTPASAGFFRFTDVNSLVIRGFDPGSPANEISIVTQGVTGKGTFPVDPGCDYSRNGAVTFTVPGGSTSTGNLVLEGFNYTDDNVANDCFRGSFDVTFTNGGATRHVTGTFDLSMLGSF